MKKYLSACLISLLASQNVWAQENTHLTIYNQNFGVVRQMVSLDLTSGSSTIMLTDVTRMLEPDSVVLRNPKGKSAFHLVEQSYNANLVSSNSLLKQYEGKTLDFELLEDGKRRIVLGKVISVGETQQYTGFGGYDNYGNSFNAVSPTIIEIEGKLRFSLFNIYPLFPSLGKDALLKPTLSLTIESAKTEKQHLELAYVTGGMMWEADYNAVLPENSDVLDITGLVTMQNRSGKSFLDATIQLMAGNVKKLQPQGGIGGFGGGGGGFGGGMAVAEPNVSEKSFDEYHLYTLNRKTSLKNGDMKQVEFARGENVASKRLYIYDGAVLRDDYNNGIQESGYGTASNPKVWVIREFANTKANGLGIPLPKGKVRFYRREGDSLQFIGENKIDHTPKDEKVRLYTGDAFDIVGGRIQKQYTYDGSKQTIDEGFEIKIRNHKKEPVEVRVVEHLYRQINWEIRENNMPFTKLNSNTMEFAVSLAPDEEKTLTYTAHYWW
jgi:hypothetical protein